MILRYIGLAEETLFNQAAEAVIHLDMASASLDSPADTQMVYAGGLQRGARTHRPGFYSPSGNIVYAFDVRSIAYLLKWALGGYLFTGGSPNMHEFYGQNDIILPSFCTRLGKDRFEHVFTGCVINSLELKVEGEYCMVTADIIAAKDAKASLEEVSNLLLPEEYPLAFHEMTLAIGSDVSAKFKDFTLTIANGLNAESGRSVGSRYPRRIPAGEREITFSANLWFENTDELEVYWGDSTGPADSGSTEFSPVITFDAGLGGSLEISLPTCIYTQVQQQPSGRDELVQAVAGKAFMDTIELSDASNVESEILVTVENELGDLDSVS
ncbi:MAG: phage tail tube protein [Bacilli bacterium]